MALEQTPFHEESSIIDVYEPIATDKQLPTVAESLPDISRHFTNLGRVSVAIHEDIPTHRTERELPDVDSIMNFRTLGAQTALALIQHGKDSVEFRSLYRLQQAALRSRAQ
jgi:hypothetical protein